MMDKMFDTNDYMSATNLFFAALLEIEKGGDERVGMTDFRKMKMATAMAKNEMSGHIDDVGNRWLAGKRKDNETLERELDGS